MKGADVALENLLPALGRKGRKKREARLFRPSTPSSLLLYFPLRKKKRRKKKGEKKREEEERRSRIFGTVVLAHPFSAASITHGRGGEKEKGEEKGGERRDEPERRPHASHPDRGDAVIFSCFLGRKREGEGEKKKGRQEPGRLHSVPAAHVASCSYCLTKGKEKKKGGGEGGKKKERKSQHRTGHSTRTKRPPRPRVHSSRISPLKGEKEEKKEGEREKWAVAAPPPF